jgi:hypothetical protein
MDDSLEAEIKRLGASKQLSDRHDQERENQTETLEEERGCHPREFHDANALPKRWNRKKNRRPLTLT